ncbi:phosphodiester glycosidase family protein [Bacteroides oleiciplenus]|uniref:Phosphodiester glycosidase family protein n=1 Tax=Bacteroides oleiciplenus TaxID=626931 RepID=A0A3E5BKF6_9BACE|nr:phosphodiester glycosidase family protein [Bacteroides oleiciplenus]RGN38090.1 phosphodiester glycosidase family protein [Bacteroides oleiciplenus]
MNFRKSILMLLLILCNAFIALAQTATDSLAIITADWNITSMGKGILLREAEFTSLYGVPQHIAILQIKPEQHRFDILIHSPKEETSIAAYRSGAVAAINGAYFNVKRGTSICYLRKDGVVIDTTATGILSTVSTGAVRINKGKLDIIPWHKQDEKTCDLKEGSILSSGPLMLLDGKDCDLSTCNKSFVKTKHPRSAVALMEDGSILLIAVAGRFTGKAEGINIPELTHLLRVLGARKALNLDGGGSTTLWSASAPGNGIVNKLCDNNLYDNEGERQVANSLCVYE